MIVPFFSVFLRYPSLLPFFYSLSFFALIMSTPLLLHVIYISSNLCPYFFTIPHHYFLTNVVSIISIPSALSFFYTSIISIQFLGRRVRSQKDGTLFYVFIPSSVHLPSRFPPLPSFFRHPCLFIPPLYYFYLTSNFLPLNFKFAFPLFHVIPHFSFHCVLFLWIHQPV